MRWLLTLFLLAACTTADDAPELSSTDQEVQWQQGEIDVLVLMAEFETDIPHATLNGWAVEQMTELDAFVRANSYGRAWLDVDYRGPYLLSASGCLPPPPYGNNDAKILRDVALLADPTVDFSEYEVVVVLSKDQDLCASGNSGNGPGVMLQFNIPTQEPLTGGWLRTSLQQTGPPHINTYANFAHELGHVLGAAHIDVVRCFNANGTHATLVHSAAQGSCNLEFQYEVSTEPMAFSRYSHYSAANKARFGWLDPAEMVSSREGLYTLTPLSEPGGLKLIEIPLLSSQHVSYTLEYRQPTNYDANTHPNGPALSGVFMHVKYGLGGGSWWLEAIDLPPFETTTSIRISALPLATMKPGNVGYEPSYVDAAQNLAIYVYSMSPTGAVVGISRPTTNWAHMGNGGTVYAPSQWSTNHAKSFANNGTRIAAWWGGWWQLGSAANVGGGCWNPSTWMYVGFGSPRWINQIDVIGLQDTFTAGTEPTLTQTSNLYGLRHFHVQYWAPWFAWVDVPGGYITWNTRVWNQLRFPALNTQYVRVWIECAQDNYARVVEVEAHGW